MAIKRLINKFTFLSILFLSLIISSQLYFADREAARIHDELNADLISGKVTNLLFLLNGDESLRSDWEEQYKDLLITLNNYPDLRRLILKNLESLNHSIENFSFQDRSFNSTEASRAGNHLIIKDILRQLDNYSYQTSQRLLKLQRDSLYMELSLILVFTIFSLFIFNFYHPQF